MSPVAKFTVLLVLLVPASIHAAPPKNQPAAPVAKAKPAAVGNPYQAQMQRDLQYWQMVQYNQAVYFQLMQNELALQNQLLMQQNEFLRRQYNFAASQYPWSVRR